MLNKIYEWIGTGIANLRNGEPVPLLAADHRTGDAPDQEALAGGGRLSRKRPLECLEDGDDVVQDGCATKKSRMGDLIDTVKIAAEGVKSHSSNVATWVSSHVSPALRNILPASPAPPSADLQSLPSTSAAPAAAPWEGEEDVSKNSASLGETFAAPSTTLLWKTTKSAEPFRNERTFVGSKVCRRQACMSLVHREVPKTNGHSVSLPPSCTPKAYPLPRLGRPLNLRPQGTSSQSTPRGSSGTSGSSFSSMYEKTFPIKVVQSPTHSSSTSSSRLAGSRARCTAQESIHEEEKEVYRQLLNMVCGGQSSLHHNGSSHTIMRSHRDFTSFLSTSRRLMKVPCATGAEGTPEGPSGPPSPQEISSLGSSSLPSPAEASGGPGNRTWSPDSVLRPSGADAQRSAPSPAALQDTTSQDTQSSAFDGDSVIIVKEQKGKKPDTSSVPCFQAELWIKELTSMYDSRARERRRQIEEQEALAAQLLRQRLSEEGQLCPVVEVHVRVPLEKEVPLTPVTEEPEPKLLEEKPEFPELNEEMEEDVNMAMRGGSPHEVLSEGFGLSLTRKDLQTLSNLNWLNDEVINFYMNLLVQRSKDPGLPSVETFNTFFYPKLRSSGYASVRRWTKKIDVFAVDILLVPVHLGVHWCLSVVDLRKKVVSYFDSMGGNNEQACNILLDYLQQESRDKKGKELDTSGWTVHSKRRNEIPQQMNGSDCGMFTCKYAEYITKDKPITFTQSHMPYFRKRMIWELLNRQLL